ncbi:MAG: amidohydrolase family protein, partial [Pseudomonadota bacterium]
EGRSGEGWHPEEAVSRETALKMLTYWPAYAAFQEDVLGTVEVGKIADFTVFDRDLLTIPDAEILEAKAVMTVVDGDVVWSAE